MYDIAIILYAFMVRMASLFNKKARKMLSGQKKTFSVLVENIDPQAHYIWFHAASLGEFEQGRPLIEKIRKEKPEYKILLTFFSPSGYEVRKDYAGANVVCYLPFDFRSNAQKFLDRAKPEIAVFIKYEFWMNYLNQLKNRDIPTYIISAVFRPSQIFFRWYGSRYRNVLNNFNWFFVQDENSLKLLRQFNHNNITVSGDTRFDRVYEIFKQGKNLPSIEKFVNKMEATQRVLIAGSTWEKDEEILIPFFNRHQEIKLIIAPHEINGDRIVQLKNRIKRPCTLYSQSGETEVETADCLIIDCIGLLSSAYRYGEIAYVGGGFGAGIHNVPEAAVYGIPVLFGPNYGKCREAKELIASGGAFSVSGENDFSAQMNNLSAYPELIGEAGKKAGDYIMNNLDATHKIYEKVFSTRSIFTKE
ncbi:MAG: 3-deoxy-D-manno-octulosonic acid transferase [Dysgonamonadaceae bacterium]|jgi:3-deoxy-D-manno-octulosonic-acid transferase|nr:3-deoxy-D-manno-octulosonic acid transferase [Dysgonamonadaceae bacterium]